MPQVVITLRIGSINAWRTARSLVAGLTPPLASVAAISASVAAISARSRQSTRTAHCLK